MSNPVLMVEQQNKLLRAQLGVLTAKVALIEAHKLMEQRNADLNNVVNLVIAELQINPNAYTLDLDTLTLVPIGN